MRSERIWAQLLAYVSQYWYKPFIDLPIPEKDKQNTPSFSADVMTGLARWKNLGNV